jgi:hypothetical protein
MAVGGGDDGRRPLLGFGRCEREDSFDERRLRPCVGVAIAPKAGRQVALQPSVLLGGLGVSAQVVAKCQVLSKRLRTVHANINVVRVAAVGTTEDLPAWDSQVALMTEADLSEPSDRGGKLLP